jgi:hypothetical protein
VLTIDRRVHVRFWIALLHSADNRTLVASQYYQDYTHNLVDACDAKHPLACAEATSTAVDMHIGRLPISMSPHVARAPLCGTAGASAVMPIMHFTLYAIEQ